jgi:tetrahydrodipicolinate N-succinyltransferase
MGQPPRRFPPPWLIEEHPESFTNPAKDIKIGNRVWIGAHVSILKGSEIGDGSVVAIRSLVNDKFPANVLLAGIPARVKRHDISWGTIIMRARHPGAAGAARNVVGIWAAESPAT